MKKIWIMGIIAISFILIAQTAMAATGTINKINRPENHGMIERTDDGSNDLYQYQIPQGLADSNNAPVEGNAVTFTPGPGQARMASDVAKDGNPDG